MRPLKSTLKWKVSAFRVPITHKMHQIWKYKSYREPKKQQKRWTLHRMILWQHGPWIICSMVCWMSQTTPYTHLCARILREMTRKIYKITTNKRTTNSKIILETIPSDGYQLWDGCLYLNVQCIIVSAENCSLSIVL